MLHRVEDYGALPDVESVALSPDGRLLAFKKNDGRNEIVSFVSIEDGKFLQGLYVNAIKVNDLEFLSNTKLVGVTAEHKRVARYRESFDVSTAFLLDLTSGEVDQLLTPGDVIYTGQTGLGRIVDATVDGKYVFMPVFVPENKRDQQPNYELVRVELESPARPAVIEKGSDYSIGYLMNGKGSLIAEVRFSSRAKIFKIISYRGTKKAEIFSRNMDIPEIGVVRRFTGRKITGDQRTE